MPRRVGSPKTSASLPRYLPSLSYAVSTALTLSQRACPEKAKECHNAPNLFVDLAFSGHARCDRVSAVDTAYDKDGRYLGKLADVFGDPTRRGIYRHLRGASEPLSASEVAEVFGVHRTVARAHMEKLAQLGLVEFGTRRRSGGGRPAKTYVLTAERLEVMLPPRRYERLSRFLLRLIDSTVEPEVAGDHGGDVQPPPIK